jgi:hypothetical protein
MSFFAGLASSFTENLKGHRAEQQRQAEQQADRESRILEHLSTSDDPEIASMALTGLISQAGPRKPKKGLKGWFGEVEQNPMLPTIRQLISAGKDTPDRPRNLADQPMQEPSGPEPTQGMPAGAGQEVTSPSLTHGPRPVFLPPEERARRDAGAAVHGRIGALREEMQAAGDDPLQQELVRGGGGFPRARSQGKPMMFTMANGERIPGTYDPQTKEATDPQGNPLTGFIDFHPVAPEPRQRLNEDKVEDPPGSGKWSWVTHDADTGKVLYRIPGAPPPTQPPANSGTTVVVDENGNPARFELPRGGGLGAKLGDVPPPASEKSDQQKQAESVVQDVLLDYNAQLRLYGGAVPAGLRDTLVQKYNTKFGVRRTFAQWLALSKGAGVNPPPSRGAAPGAAPSRGRGPANDPEGLRQFLPQ